MAVPKETEMAVPPLVPLGTGPNYCPRCYALLEMNPLTGQRLDDCWACRRLRHLDDVLCITYLTAYPLPQRIGSDIKYMKDEGERRHVADVAPVLHRYLETNADVIRQVWQPTIVTYVPTHAEKVARRGFDHMAEIVNFRPNNVRRFGIRPILRQVNAAEMPTQGRRINPDDFALLDGIEVNGARVLLLDDTLTSGTTSASIAQLLRRHSAERVYLLAIARALGSAYDEVVAELGDRPFDWAACKLRIELPADAARTASRQ